MSNTYSFVDVQCSLNGPTGTAYMGYGAGVSKEGITISRKADSNRLTVGADGTPMNSMSVDRSGTVTIRLMKISKTNAILSAMHELQRANSALWGNNSIVITQKVSGDVTTMTSVAFQKFPDLSYTDEGDMMTWTFDAGDCGTVLGTY